MGLFGGKRQPPDTTEAGGERSQVPENSGAGTGLAGGQAERITRAKSMGSSSEQRTVSGVKPPSGGQSVANIGKSIIIKGDLSGDEDLEIEGTVDGRIQLPKNQVTIGANGQINAEIDAKAIVIIGKVNGDLRASERVEVQSTGVVEGDVRSPRLLIQEGAIVNGAVDMTRKEDATAQKDTRDSAEARSGKTPSGSRPAPTAPPA